MKHRLETASVFTDPSGERMWKVRILVRLCAAALVTAVLVVVAVLESGVSLRDPALPGVQANLSGDDHRSERPDGADPSTDHRQTPSDVEDSPPAGDSSTEPEPSSAGTKATADLDSADGSSSSSDDPSAGPSHGNGSRPTEPPGKSKK